MNFIDLINDSRQFNGNEFLRNYGSIVDDAVSIHGSDFAQGLIRKARELIDERANEEVAPGIRRLQAFDFWGDQSKAPELLEGKVAAVDGTYVLPPQKYTVGFAMCVGVGSKSYLRKIDNELFGYTTATWLDTEAATSLHEYRNRIKDEKFSISATAYMRYWEAKRALEIEEPFVFCDGPIVYEWLARVHKMARDLSVELIEKKHVIGIIKSLHDNTDLGIFGRVLRPGEVYIQETLYDHMRRLDGVPSKDHAENRYDARWESDRAFADMARNIVRGVFKPRGKAFGFECHTKDFPAMIRLVVADCQMNHPGHEIPYLLELIDQTIRTFFRPNIVKDMISQRLSMHSDELFFGEGEERDFR